jgi:hypothetical protein
MLCEKDKLKFSEVRGKKYNINFLSNIFQSGVINVTLRSLLIKTKQISFIYHKNCITTFLVICYNSLNAHQHPKSSPTAAGIYINNDPSVASF